MLHGWLVEAAYTCGVPASIMKKSFFFTVHLPFPILYQLLLHGSKSECAAAPSARSGSARCEDNSLHQWDAAGESWGFL